MKIVIGTCLLAACLTAQDSTKTTTPPAPKAAVKKPVTQSGIPKDAIQTTPGFYRWTDKDGKVWMYRQTPFGVSRWPADSVDITREAAEKNNAVGELTTAVDEGDSVRFERGTPFGKRTWVRKKTELNETEQRIWDQQQRKNAASGPAAAEKAEPQKTDKE